MNLELVSKTWKQRKKSNVIKWLMRHSNLQIEEMADYLGCSAQYLNNKLHRDSFSIDDLLIAAKVSGYTVVLIPDQEGGEKVSIDFFDWFKDYDEEALYRFAKRGKHVAYKALVKHRVEYESKPKQAIGFAIPEVKG